MRLHNIFYVGRNSYAGLAGNHNYLLQYDLNAIDIPASCDTLDSTLYPPADCGAVRMAPDGKIYYAQCYVSPTALGYPYADTMRNKFFHPAPFSPRRNLPEYMS